MSTTVIGMDASRTVADVGAEILDVCDRGSGVHSGAELGLTVCRTCDCPASWFDGIWRLKRPASRRHLLAVRCKGALRSTCDLPPLR